MEALNILNMPEYANDYEFVVVPRLMIISGSGAHMPMASRLNRLRLKSAD